MGANQATLRVKWCSATLEIRLRYDSELMDAIIQRYSRTNYPISSKPINHAQKPKRSGRSTMNSENLKCILIN
ncbi:MAG: hypothetical protein ACTSQG_08395 [Promethearchaeota archaeon]